MTAETLHAHVKYEPLTGLFFRIIPSRRSKAGALTGSLHKSGYLTIGILGDRYWSHVLAWLYMTGGWPDETVDHENRVRTDNRWKNLLPATYEQQAWNRGPLKNVSKKASRYIGVHRQSGTDRWVARITAKGIRHELGSFVTQEEARAAYLAAKVIHHPGAPLH